MRRVEYVTLIAGALALGGCAAAPPTGPNVMVLPGKDKSFEAFQADDAACRQYASTQIGDVAPAEAASQSAVGSTVLGTALGAAAGAAVGAASGNPAAGAAIGAASGLFVGGTSGLSAAQASGASLQRRYDTSYIQCMSAKGENVQAASAGYYSFYPTYGSYYPSYPVYYGPAFVSVGAFFGFHHHHRFHDSRQFHNSHQFHRSHR